MWLLERPVGLDRLKPSLQELGLVVNLAPELVELAIRSVVVVLMELLVANRPKWWKLADWDQRQLDRPED